VSRLRNRIRKAGRYTDGELLRWHRDKRATYDGLWSIAEDSGCLEDDPLDWKVTIWPAPSDSDITVELLTRWRDELVADGKLIPYEVAGKSYLFIRSFHRHEKPTNPQQADLPLPPWVVCEAKEGTAKDRKRWSRCSYRVVEELMPTRPGVCTESVQSENGVCTSSPVLPCTALPGTALPGQEPLSAAGTADGGCKGSGEQSPGTAVAVDDGFAAFWSVYPRREDKKRSHSAWHRLTKAERVLAVGVAEIMTALVVGGHKERRYVPIASSFLNGKRWEDWREGVPAGWEPPGNSVAAQQAANLAAAVAAANREEAGS
jgi:hypothetical protein